MPKGRWRRNSLPLLIMVLIAISVVAWALHVEPWVVFLFGGIALVPLAYSMGLATEELAKHFGPGLGGLLNATFGNATEIIIALFALSAGLVEVVKASITGSIIGNLLLVLGLSMLFGGVRFKKQTFERRAAGTRSTMLALAVAGLLMPTVAFYSMSFGAGEIPGDMEQASLFTISLAISAILLVTYFAGLLFSLHTHRHIFNPRREVEEPSWSKRRGAAVLGLATVLVALESEILVDAIGGLVELGFSYLFLGVIVLAIVGNAAEHGSAIIMAWKNKMDLSVGIATASSTQIALFAAPFLVFASAIIGNHMSLAFEIFELISIALSVAVVGMVSSDGESNWFEGVLLVMVYVIIAIGFFFHP